MTQNNQYMPQLDSLRAFAVLAVLYHHYTFPDIPWGSYGVTLFFVLSGFLITRIILNHREQLHEGVSTALIARNFYIRRALRLFPVYYLVLLSGCFLNFDMVCETLPWHLTYTSNFLFYKENSWIGIVSPYWSLANEEQFYLLWLWAPLLLCRQKLLRVVIGVIGIAIGYRYLMDLTQQGPFSKLLLPGIFDSFAIGALLCFINPRINRSKLSSNLLFTFGCGLLLTLILLNHYVNILPKAISPTVLSLAFAMIIFGASRGVTGIPGYILSNRQLMYVGKISYGIYVMHTFAPAIFGRLPWIWRVQEANELAQFAAYTFLTFTLAAISWHFIESPINRQKKRFSEGVGSF